MANTSAIWQQVAHTTDQLSSPSCSTRAIQKSLTLNEKSLRVFWKKVRRMDHQLKNDKTERARGLGRTNKRGDRKGESDDSPEIPDKRLTSDIPGLPSGAGAVKGLKSEKGLKSIIAVLQLWCCLTQLRHTLASNFPVHLVADSDFSGGIYCISPGRLSTKTCSDYDKVNNLKHNRCSHTYKQKQQQNNKTWAGMSNKLSTQASFCVYVKPHTNRGACINLKGNT